MPVPTAPLPAAPPAPALPLDAERVLALAAQSLFDTFSHTAMGTMVVDRDHRIVWIDDGYRRFLPALGHAEADFVGRRVEDVVPNTLMGQVVDSGQPMLVDLLSNQAGTFLVTRLPLRNDQGLVIGAVGFVLLDHPETTMQPLLAKFSQLQQELDSTRRLLAQQRAELRRPRYSIASFIGSSSAALEVKRQARRVAQTGSTVLLLGETGTGKELLAHAIHAASRRAAKALVGVNIAAIPDTLLEAEFFGVAPGAYTGAERKGRDGKFKLADGGTLFLDEIGDMPLALQSKLLRALQEQEIEPLGSNRIERVDVRIIAATSRNLAEMVAQGLFRADLYYRLNVLPILVPPLRDRLADLEALADALLDDIARRSGLTARSLTSESLAWLGRRAWPGNIRELSNSLEQAALMTDDVVLGLAHFGAADMVSEPVAEARALPAAQLLASTASTASTASQVAAVEPALSPSPAPSLPTRSLSDQVAALERWAIAQALVDTGGNRAAAAKQLGMPRSVLYQRLALYPEIGQAAPLP